MINELYKKYNDAQAFLHKFGLSSSNIEEETIDQATLKTGHTISYSEIRAGAIPAVRTKTEACTKLLQYKSDAKLLSIENLEISNKYKDTIVFYNKKHEELFYKDLCSFKLLYLLYSQLIDSVTSLILG